MVRLRRFAKPSNMDSASFAFVTKSLFHGVHPGLLSALYAVFEEQGDEQGDDWISVDVIHKKGTIFNFMFISIAS